MVKGRKSGQIELSIEEIETIINMTLSKDPEYNRTEIAMAIGRSKNTVLRYQKYFNLI